MTFEFDLSLYSLIAIKKASYRFLASYNVEIAQPSTSLVVVTLTRKPGVSDSMLDGSYLPNEVLDQDLREQVARETKPLAELLLAQAFAGLQLTDPIGEIASEIDDPLLIRRPSGPAAAHGAGAHDR